MKNFKVVRPDNSVDYATGEERDGKMIYLLYGSGFSILEFDAKSVEEIDEIPTDFTRGKAFFDDGAEYRAVVNVNNRWNGWYMPFIAESDIERFIEDTSWGEMSIRMDGRVVVVEDEGEVTRIKPTGMYGENWYYFGDMGWCFNFKKERFNLTK